MSLLHTKEDVIAAIAQDEWMLQMLALVQQLELPDWWISAGFVRNKVWDVLHNYSTRSPLNDVDVIYFDLKETGEIRDKRLEAKLRQQAPRVPWSVKNQARMYEKNGDQPYTSSSDAMSRWPETATCVGVSLDATGKIVLAAPNGVQDLVNLIVRRNHLFAGTREQFLDRVERKQWRRIWPRLSIVDVPT